MTTLPVREMVLYKHGVGFFVREGAVSDDKVTLTFREDEINDVLKSLVAFDRAGGHVLGIHYQTPMDKAARLANTSIKLGTIVSLSDLVRDLRGRVCSLQFETTPGTTESVRGRIIGQETIGDRLSRHRVSVLADNGQVRVFRLGDLRGLKIEDAQSEHDLSYFLDTSMSEDTRRFVSVRLSEGEHQLVVYYVAPSPTWRVSYRLVAETNENGQTGKALLQGWGLFDNRLEEDLDNVRVTLVAGQPISFIYDLYGSRIPTRPTVKDESRIAPGPVEYQGGSLLRRLEKPAAAAKSAPARHLAMASIRPASDLKSRIQNRILSELDPANAPDKHLLREQIQSLLDSVLAEENMVLSRAERLRLFESIVGDVLGMSGVEMDSFASLEDLAVSTPVQVETKTTGETFQYVVTTLVSVKRGESALVPIIGSEVNYERELLYNGAKLPNHPVASLRFMNNTGLTLERGPVTVVEDGDYKGEAVIPFTKEEQSVYVPYAVELGVRVVEDHTTNIETFGLEIAKEQASYKQYQITTVRYTLENTTNKPKTVTIEAPIPQKNAELFDTRRPDVETLTEVRWKVELPPQRKTQFIRKTRLLQYAYLAYRSLSYAALETALKNRWLDEDTFNRLALLVDKLNEIRALKGNKAGWEEERKNLFDQQENIRKNLGALQPTGQEATLRNRLLKQLEASQNRLDEIERDTAAAKAQIDALEKDVDEMIRTMGEPQY